MEDEMYLTEWINTYRHYAAQHGSGSWYVHAVPGDVGYADLFHLDDYAVSSVASGVVWLVAY
jgi:hypothetical protein